MPVRNLKIDELLLDLTNPRTREVQSQRDALQGVIDDQKLRLAALAEDIAEHGLNPADRLLVMHQRRPKGYVTLEGNRRVATLQILKNPSVLNGLSLSAPLKRRLEAAAKLFRASKVEPVPAFSFSKREDAKRWIEMRHTGQGGGEGIVPWSGVAAARFRGNSPSLQAIDLVKRFGDLDDEEREKLEDDFSISVLDRIMGSKPMKDAFGLKTSKDILYSKVSADEAIKPLEYVIKEIMGGRLTNRTLNKRADQEKYISKMPKSAIPDLTKSIDETPADSFGQADFKPRKKTRRKRATPAQKGIWPKSFSLSIEVDRIRDIFAELKSLEVDKNKNAIAILMRIILEMSADEYMDNNSLDRKEGPKNHRRDKSLAKKVNEVCTHLIRNGAKKHKIAPVTTSINNNSSPLYHDLLNQYVHNAYHNPSPSELRSGATPLRSFLEGVWSE
ncbi:hypothetical protein [Erythrobacter sp.]|uniref:hypothetical protein n=1 Tax=Erythrobacter sp. TaxID=1042 RepID=UPI001B1277CC|nr:hypothetical protein [Erythrobacter sp.]MBO6526001.1 hypothetical protein [Erythrobacter sp.]MBO6530650.1 hypothetical protein [Erythrobacter sp.]